ncbi:hypothetical protein H312_03606 [Anncaliia algerae PRA339]|uniref:DUF155 domain-containing protein n=1 Tax=Anncaliia algerae PRA339 TaxID=1288291 RepID=A0A059EWC2_9MICR|nr:hypothetical protein H312_03606 [Anncaliia algerae PRA339]
MFFGDSSKQKIPLSTIREEKLGKKRERIELRSFKENIPLSTSTEIANNPLESYSTDDLKRLMAYCMSESIDIRKLYKDLHKQKQFNKVTIYFSECLYAEYMVNGNMFDIFFFEYGVVVFWGMDESQEGVFLQTIKGYEKKSYKASQVEIDSFQYKISNNPPMIYNDIFFLDTEDFFNKMVISCAIAQSTKLDFFENLVESTIERVIDFPMQIENTGKVNKNRQEVMKLTGSLHSLKLNLNLKSNILDEPDLLWHYPSFSNLYLDVRRYLDIKIRTDVLNQRVDVIQNILELLNNNITTRNSERLEITLIFIIVFNILISSGLIFYVIYGISKLNK